jgi:hypothetical protein
MHHTYQASQGAAKTFTFIHEFLKVHKALIFEQRKVSYIPANCEVMKEIAHHRYRKISC